MSVSFKHSRATVLALVIMWVVGACSARPQNSTAPQTSAAPASPSVPRETFPTSDADCRPPCWQGVTPGVTTLDEATRMLQDNLGAGEFAYDDTSIRGTIIATWWPLPGGLLLARQSDRVVVDVTYPLERPLALGYVIQMYGQPDYAASRTVLVGPQLEYRASLLWLTQGFEVTSDFSHQSTSEPPELSDEIPLSQLEFFQPGWDGYDYLAKLNPERETRRSRVKEWSGFVDFFSYCRPLSANDCVRILPDSIATP